MRYSIGILLCILFLCSSCGNKEKTIEVDAMNDSIAKSATRIVNRIGETLIPAAKRDMDTWKEYQDVDVLISRYYSTSIMEALTNAEELAELTVFLKDSIRVEKIEKENVIARLNVLNNEAMRLADMANIPSITDDEVKEEVAKILELYSAVNAKINTIYKSEALQDRLEVDTEVPVELEDGKKTRPKRNSRATTSSIKNN